MADPRGRGFGRGRGKWHAPRSEIILPSRYGWYLTGFDSNGRSVYRLGKQEMRFDPAAESWIVNQIGSRDGEIYPGWTLNEIMKELAEENLCTARK